MRPVLLALALTLALALAGCEAPPKDAGTPVCGRFSLGAEKASIRAGDEMGLHVRLENCGTQPLAIGATPRCQPNAMGAHITISGQDYDITNGAAQKVPAAIPPCAPPITLEMLPPGHVRDVRLVWNGTLDQGTAAPPGSYVISGAFTPAEDANKTYTAQITVEVSA